MVKKKNSKKIAWVDSEAGFTGKYRGWIEEEAEMEVKISLYQRRDHALEKIPEEKPDLIIVNPYKLNPGKVNPRVAGPNPWDDHAVAFDLVSKLQQGPPVVLISMNDLKGKYNEQFFVDRGVSEVVELEGMSSRDFYEVLEKYL
jgi:hypothetical protein